MYFTKTIILFGLLLIFSCKKNENSILQEENYIFNININCTDTELTTLPEPNTGFIFFYDNNFINYPFFNPNDPNEYIYYNQYQTNNIYIYNRTTNSKKILTITHLLSPPKWSKTNWILLDNGNIYKIKPNGDSLIKLCVGYNPECNTEGTKFAFGVINWNIGKEIGVIYNLQTNQQDTLHFMLGAGKCWQNNSNKMIFYSSEQTMQGFALVDMNTKTRTLINKIESPSPPCWINDNEFIYSYEQKIYIYNILTSKITAIAKLCPNDFVAYFSYSPTTKELITSLTHWKPLGNDSILISSKIMILNFNNNTVSYIIP